MKLNLNPKIILRIPRFPLDAKLENYWPELKELIADSSKDFYEKIKHLQYDEIINQPEKVQHTIWKYFNRSKNRSTPFGGFASVGTCSASYIQGEGKPIKISKEIKMHELYDWKTKEDVEYTYDELYESNGSVFANSTYYIVNNDTIRYVGFSNQTFEILETPKHAFILEVLKLCKNAYPIQELSLKFPDLSDVDFKEHIEMLVSMQLLKTSFDANIIGDDYFTRIGFDSVKPTVKYSISERQDIEGTFDLKILRGLDIMIQSLLNIQSDNRVDQLENFIERFRNRYDQQEVPLMIALDPEYGIGYGDLEQITSDSEIINLLGSRRGPTEKKQDLISILESKILDQTDYTLREFDIEKAISQPIQIKVPKQLPNSTSLLFTIGEGKVWIENLGGATACALAGRFTHALEEVREMTRKIASAESDANPGVIFFDIAYMGETNVDNVNRRQHIYNQQLSLLNYDTSENPITLDDITIMLEGNNLVLKSKTLKKRLIPRLATAYNHSRSDLSVFRLLCDLQHQGIHTSFNFSLVNQFPQFNFYPRINFRQFVLSTAKWRIRKADLQPNEELAEYLYRLNVSQRFRTGEGDQVLYFDKNCKEDMQVFINIFESKKEMLLEETATPALDLIHDEEKKAYTGQILVQLCHDRQVYQALDSNRIQDAPLPLQRNFLLHSEWLYYEIYCHPVHADVLLTGSIYDFLDDCKPYINQWFFIRYDEGGEHIRLRLKTNHIQDGYQITAKLSNHLTHSIQQGSVRDLKQCIYRRELERYGSDIIDHVEKHFNIDSKYAMEVIQSGLSDQQKYCLCLDLIKFCSDNLNIDKAMQLEYHTMMLSSYEKEHQLSADEFKQLNELYRKIKGFKSEYTPDYSNSSYRGMSNSFISTVNICPEQRRPQLLADLLHMHINRLFASNQRTHELAIYYMYIKNQQRSQR